MGLGLTLVDGGSRYCLLLIGFILVIDLPYTILGSIW
jgi:hypothetical protein